MRHALENGFCVFGANEKIGTICFSTICFGTICFGTTYFGAMYFRYIFRCNAVLR